MPIDNTPIYKALVERLTEKCTQLQTRNEMFVNRINKVKKNLRYQKRDLALLKSRLDKHRDNWRAVPMIAPHPKRKIEQKRGPKPKPKPSDASKTPPATTREDAQPPLVKKPPQLAQQTTAAGALPPDNTNQQCFYPVT